MFEVYLVPISINAFLNTMTFQPGYKGSLHVASLVRAHIFVAVFAEMIACTLNAVCFKTWIRTGLSGGGKFTIAHNTVAELGKRSSIFVPGMIFSRQFRRGSNLP
jgi:hypothetical protein